MCIAVQRLCSYFNFDNGVGSDNILLYNFQYLHSTKPEQAMAEGILKFDELKICTELAEAYLKNKTEFRSMGVVGVPKEDAGCVQDRFSKNVHYAHTNNGLLNYMGTETVIDPEKLYALAQKIEENAQLFCQLDYLYRKIPINHTKNIDLPLICQSLVFRGSFKDAELVKICYKRHTDIYESTPLFQLGQMAYCAFPFAICCTHATAAVCTLFFELCKEVGVEEAVTLIIEPEETEHCEEASSERGGGCVGVVGTRCDVDSAVDAFLAADIPYPWRLRRVLVHEAALERFASALTRRTRAADGEPARRFLLQLGGDERGAVPVEAYRTAREALALLAARAPLAVSVWASDAAEAHELALGAGAPLAWVNAYGLFRGSPAAAAALYTGERRLERPDSEGYPDDDVLNEMRRLRAAWLRLAPAARLQRVREALRRWRSSAREADVEPACVGLANDSVVAAQERLCIAVRKPVDVACINMDEFASAAGLARVLDYIVAGGAALVYPREEDDDKELIMLLSDIGAPVKASREFVATTQMYYIDAVWTSIGTTFAN